MIFDNKRTALFEPAVHRICKHYFNHRIISMYSCLKASPPIADGTGHIFRQGWILAASRGSGFEGASQL
jgi:hypothetical protein